MDAEQSISFGPGLHTGRRPVAVDASVVLSIHFDTNATITLRKREESKKESLSLLSFCPSSPALHPRDLQRKVSFSKVLKATLSF